MKTAQLPHLSMSRNQSWMVTEQSPNICKLDNNLSKEQIDQKGKFKSIWNQTKIR